MAQKETCDIEESIESGIDNRMPFIVAHHKHDIVMTYAGIVNQHRHVIVGMTVLPIGKARLYFGSILHIELQCLGLASLFANHLDGSGSLLGIALIIHNHRIAIRRQFQANGTANATRATGYKSIFHYCNKYMRQQKSAIGNFSKITHLVANVQQCCLTS